MDILALYVSIGEISPMILCVGHNQRCNLKKRPDSLLVNPVCAECSLTVAGLSRLRNTNKLPSPDREVVSEAFMGCRRALSLFTVTLS